MKTMQEIFDISLNHIRQQGGPSIKNEVCRYLSSDGLKCAAAPFITLYKKYLEGLSWAALAEKYPDSIDPEVAGFESFIGDLQGIHDASARQNRRGFMEEYELRMKIFASKKGLEYKAPEARREKC